MTVSKSTINAITGDDNSYTASNPNTVDDAFEVDNVDKDLESGTFAAQEAADEKNPLYERIKFLAIFSSNLDEFFKVRVSGIRKIKQLNKPLRKRLITKPNKLLREIKEQVDIQQKEFGRIFFTEIIPALQSEDIHLLSYREFNEEQQGFSKEYYKEKIQPSNL